MTGTVTMNTSDFIEIVNENSIMKARIENLENYIMERNRIKGTQAFLYEEEMKCLGITKEQMKLFSEQEF